MIIPFRSAARKRSAPRRIHEVPGTLVEHLLEARTILIFGEVTMGMAEQVTAQLFALSALGSEPISVVVHSPGGHVEAADTIFDSIRFVEPQVTMLGTGWVASAGALIYLAVEQRYRLALPNTRFLLHQPLGEVGGPTSDVEIEAQQILAMRERLNRIFAEGTGQPLQKIVKDTDRNKWMSAEQAVEYGLVGRIVRHTRVASGALDESG